MLAAGISIKIVAAVVALLCLGLGALMLFLPRAFISANLLSKKWIATNKIEEQLNRTRDFDRQLIGIRRVLGFILLVLALFLAYLLLN